MSSQEGSYQTRLRTAQKKADLQTGEGQPISQPLNTTTTIDRKTVKTTNDTSSDEENYETPLESNKSENKDIIEISESSDETDTDTQKKNNSNTEIDKMTTTKEEATKFIEKRVPEFSGNEKTKTTDVKYFIDMCKKAQEKFGEDFKETVLEEIKFKLTHEAYTKCASKDIKTLDELMTKITSTYLQKTTVEQLHKDLVDATQNPTESMSDYSSRVQSLTNNYREGLLAKYKKDFPAEIVEDTAIQAFRNGLKRDRLRIALACTEYATLKDISEAAIKTDATLKVIRDEFSHKNTATNSVTCRYCNKIGHYERDCRKKLADSRRQTTKCNFCQRLGHIEQDCRTKSRQHTQSQPQSQPQTQQRQIRQCNFCSKPGHLESECYAKARKQANHSTERQTTQCNYCKKFGHTVENCRNKPNYNNNTNFANGWNKGQPNVSINYITDDRMTPEEESENKQGLTSNM